MQPFDAYSRLLGYRQVTNMLNKQEQFTPIGREPSELLALSMNIWRYSKSRETRAESSNIYKVTNGSATHISFLLLMIKNDGLSSLLGVPYLVRPHPDVYSSVCFLFYVFC